MYISLAGMSLFAAHFLAMNYTWSESDLRQVGQTAKMAFSWPIYPSSRYEMGTILQWDTLRIIEMLWSAKHEQNVEMFGVVLHKRTDNTRKFLWSAYFNLSVLGTWVIQ